MTCFDLENARPVRRGHLTVRCQALGIAALACATRAGHAQLSYRDSSAGLQVPRMEAGPTELEFSDVNGDGHVDIVSIGDHGSPHINSDETGIMVWFGDGEGAWSLYQTGNFGYGGVALGDVNGDGLMDAAYAMHHNYSGTDFGNQLMEVALGDGTGRNWTPYDNGLAASGEDYGMFGTDLADFDNDGDLDMASISFGCCSGVHVYRNNGDGTWTQTFGFLGGNSSLLLSTGDFNGDGNADLATGSQNGTVYFGDGTGAFTLTDGNLPARGSSGRQGISVGDVNADGLDDLSFATSAGGLAVWRWVSGSTWANLSGNLPTGGGHRLTQIADMNADGFGDLVAFSETKTEVFLGDGSGQWQLAATINAQPNTCDYAAFRAGADVDHNGYPDPVSIAEENCRQFTGGQNRPRCFVEASLRTDNWIHPLSLRGGETVRAGSVRFIDWTAQVSTAPSEIGTVTIELSLSGDRGPWLAVARDTLNNGRSQWPVPADLPRTSRARLRLTLESSLGRFRTITPRPFSIAASGEPVPGDTDGDGDIDLRDWSRLQACFTGEDEQAEPECTASDVDADGDVDAADHAAQASRLTGP